VRSQQFSEFDMELGRWQLGVVLYLEVDEQVFVQSDNIDGRLERQSV
jgi:hypothetical protein